MKNVVVIFLILLAALLISGKPTQAQRGVILASPSPIVIPGATDSATASDSAIATPSAAVERIQEKKDNDITETSGKKKDALTAFLDEKPISELTWHNVLQHGLRRAINNGLPANIIVVLILFPIITSIIAASRHLIGLQGFGIYIPAVLSVAFVSTGITTGVAVFAAVLIAATVFKALLKRLRLQYLPRTALLLWGVSLVILILLVLASLFGVSGFLSLNIFPLLIIMLLTENFMETQLTSSTSQTIQLTVETLVIAIVCSLLIGNEYIQRIVLLRPEATFISVAVFNLVVGRYSGLRLLEYIRFRSLIER